MSTGRSLRSVVRTALLVLVAAVAFVPANATASDGSWVWPLDPRPTVARPFEAPRSDYGAGHRGVDLRSQAGAWVRAVDDGTVAYVGTIAGVGSLSVDHGGVRSTYQPVSATVHRGQVVRAGDPIGRLLLAGTHCGLDACLHLGRKVGSSYADPLELLSTASRIRLVSPVGPVPTQRAAALPSGPGVLTAPVLGPISSPYGMRVHPITGVFKLHDGTDFAAPCGTAVRSAAAGVVSGVSFDRAYGNRVLVEHVLVDGTAVSTSYNHLAETTVRTGQRLRGHEVVGRVGATGLATGCHLHFMVVLAGRTVDPMEWLSR